MKKIVIRKNFVKVASVLLIVLALLFSNFFVMASPGADRLIQSIETNEFSSVISRQNGKAQEIILFENFTDEFSWPDNPPQDPRWGEWELNCTNMGFTWYRDTTNCWVEPAWATVKRSTDTSVPKYDMMITPCLDFTGLTEVYMSFCWWGDYKTSVEYNYTDFNVKVSIDNGSSWNTIWCEEDHIGFRAWTYYKEILDLSIYSGYSEMRIGIQFYSKSTQQSDIQEFSIDEIRIYYPVPSEFSCDAGGPYYWYWETQRDYDPEGARLHGSVKPYGLQYDWVWDFGDGNTSTHPFNTWNFYDEIKIYNVTLTVTDNTKTPPLETKSNTTIDIFLIPPPKFKIVIPSLCLGIKATIENTADYNASYVDWNITVDWGRRQRLTAGVVGNGTFDNIPSKTPETIRSKFIFLAFGKIHITIRMDTENLVDTIKHFEAFKIGPFVLFAH